MLGGDGYRVLAVRSAGLGWSAAVAPVLVQRATSYVALALLALPALAWLTVGSRIPLAILAAALLLCSLAGGVAFVLLVAPAWLTPLRARLSRNRTRPDGGSPPDAAALARPPIRSIAIATGYGVAFHLVSVLFTALLLLAVDPSAAGVGVLAAIVVARLSLAVPILPSGLGANEAILALLFAGLGLAPQSALAGLLLGRVALVLTTLLGAGLLLLAQPRIATGETRTGPQPASAPRLQDATGRATRRLRYGELQPARPRDEIDAPDGPTARCVARRATGPAGKRGAASRRTR